MATRDEKFLQPNDGRTPAKAAFDPMKGKDGYSDEDIADIIQTAAQQRQAREVEAHERAQAQFPLHAAAFDPTHPDGVNLTKLREALDQGANVNAHDEQGRTALAVTHSVEAAQMLIDAGAGFDPDLYYGDEPALWNDRSPQFQELVGEHQKRMEQEDMDRVGELSGLNEHDEMTPLEELQQAHLTSGYQARQTKEQASADLSPGAHPMATHDDAVAKQVEQKAPEAAPVAEAPVAKKPVMNIPRRQEPTAILTPVRGQSKGLSI